MSRVYQDPSRQPNLLPTMANISEIPSHRIVLEAKKEHCNPIHIQIPNISNISTSG